MAKKESKRKMLHIPKYCVGLYIKFESLEAREEFANSEEYKLLIGNATVKAKEAKGSLVSFWNPK